MGPTIIDVQTIANTVRKRPIDWETLDISPSVNATNCQEGGGSPAKIRMSKDDGSNQPRKSDATANGMLYVFTKWHSYMQVLRTMASILKCEKFNFS